MELAKASVILLTAAACGGQTFTRFTISSLADTPTLSQAFDVAAADLNGDGRPDLAVTAGTAIHVFLADDQRVLRWRASYRAGSRLLSLVAADFSGSGKIDLAAADFNGAAIVVLEGAGDGTFRQAPPIKVDASPAYLAAGDLNGDGRADLVVSHQTGTLTVFRAGAGGALTAVQGISNTRRITNEDILLADMNGDGVPDLAAGHSGGSTVSVFRGLGDGTFGAETEVPAGAEPTLLCAGDFNQDGIIDLLAGGPRATGVYVLFGDGSGGFRTPLTVSSPGRPTFLLPGDWNGDGKPEVAVSRFDNDSVAVWETGDAAGLQSPRLYETDSGPRAAAAADFDGDGVADLAVLNSAPGNINVFSGSRGGPLAAAYNLGPPDPAGLVGGRFCGNGDGGLAVASRGLDSVLVLCPGDEGRLTKAAALPLGRVPSAIVQADFTADGTPDIAVGHSRSSQIRIFPGLPGGGFGPAIVLPSPTSLALAAGDLNGDGLTDIAALGVGTPFLTVGLSRGEGRFEPWRTVRADNALVSAAVFDWDNDGFTDVLLGGYNGLLVVRGDGSGQFQAPEMIAAGAITAVTTGAIDDDAKPDLIGLDSDAGRILVSLGGSGKLEAKQSAFDRLRHAAAADLNADGHPDVAVAHVSPLGPAVSIYSGAGAAPAPPPRAYAVELVYPDYMAAVDLNRDGLPDLAFAGGGQESIAVAWNDPAPDQPPAPPAPRAPADDTAVPQNVAIAGCAAEARRGNGYVIRFRWDAPPAGELLAGYELQAWRQGGGAALLDGYVVPPGQEFVVTRCLGLIGPDELDGWRWRVRARYATGAAGEWSETAGFQFAPCRLADGSACGSPGGGAPAVLESQLSDRTWHSATPLAGGDVLVAGGVPQDANAATEVYAAASGRFKGGAAMSVGRSNHTATPLPGGKVLLAGGSGRRASAEIYDPSTGTFEAPIEMPERLVRHTATALADGRVLIAGGNALPYYAPSRSALIFDPSTRQFTPAGTLNSAHWGHTATLLGTGEVLIVGDTYPAEIYNPVSGGFRQIGPTLAPKSGHTATLLASGQVLLISASGPELFDPAANRFEPLPAMSYPRYGHTATLLDDGSVLIAGGISSDAPTNHVERYDPVARRFEVLPPLSVARSHHTATRLANGGVLIVGGLAPPAVRSVEVYAAPAR